MITVIRAQEEIAQRIIALEAEVVPLSQAHGRVLREAVASPEDLPGFDRSAMDGYAIRRDETSSELEVIGEIRAGEVIDRDLRPGEAIRIFTGARLPGLDLKVVVQELVKMDGKRLHILKQDNQSHVRHRGEDARAGEVLLEPGLQLNAMAVALLASVGKTSLLVSRLPRILHVTTGDEIVAPEEIPALGQIRNSNAALISSLCHEGGVEVMTHLHFQDNLPAMIRALSEAKAETYDLVLISGGSGPGACDFSPDLFRHLEATIHFREVNVRPGKPLIFGTAGTRVVFGLPGNALSHFVCFHLFVRTAIDSLLARPTKTTQCGFLREALPDPRNARETWWPARASVKEGRVELRALPWKSSGDITRVTSADTLIRVPASTADLPAGTMVDFLPL